MTADVLVKSKEVASESCFAGIKDYCTFPVYLVPVYRLRADPTFTLALAGDEASLRCWVRGFETMTETSQLYFPSPTQVDCK